MTTTYTVTLTNRADIEVRPLKSDIDNYGLVQAILEAARKTPAYKAAAKSDDARVHSLWIDGEEVTQF